jgi:hypothetical protein
MGLRKAFSYSWDSQVEFIVYKGKINSQSATISKQQRKAMFLI